MDGWMDGCIGWMCESSNPRLSAKTITREQPPQVRLGTIDSDSFFFFSLGLLDVPGPSGEEHQWLSII
jgi:hypothetical protein